MDTWTAVYAPDREQTVSGFETEQDAWNYVHSHMCKSCKEAYERSKTEDVPTIDWASCEAEWFVIPTVDHEQAEGFEDILEAAGYEFIPTDLPT